MAGFAVFYTFVALFLASVLAIEKSNLQNEEFILTELSDLLQSPKNPMNQRDQMQRRQFDTGRGNPGSCSQTTWDYSNGPVCPNYYRNCGGSTSGKPRDCTDLYKRGHTTSGVYVIYPDMLQQGIYVRCDMDTAGGGWTVIQRRVNGNVDFNRTWSDYKQGFGDLNGNFWLGNDNIHAITAQGDNQLRIDMLNFTAIKTYAIYSSFKVGDENSGYFLTAGGYSGTAGDYFSYDSGIKFTTKDQDNDYVPGNCADDVKGAWWHKSCSMSNLNGIYGANTVNIGTRWSSFILMYVDMKVRRP